MENLPVLMLNLPHKMHFQYIALVSTIAHCQASFILLVYFQSLKGLIHMMCHQTATCKGIFSLCSMYRYFSNFPLFTDYFGISFSVFLSITNINIIFYDYIIHAISSRTLTSQSLTSSSLLFHL